MLKLFEPTKVGKVGLRNRIVFPATGTHYVYQDGTVSQRLIDWIGLEVAALLSQQGNDVTVVEKEWLGRGIARGQRSLLVDRLSKDGVHFLPQVEVTQVKENSLVLLDKEPKKHSLDADWLVFASLAEIDNQPIDWLVGQPFGVLWVNPVQSPRDWVSAFEEGTSVARRI